MPVHETSSPLAGKTVRLRPDFFHIQCSIGGQYAEVEDWWDKVYGKSWMNSTGNPAAIIYAARSGFSPYPIPTDDEVLYVHVGAFGHLVHVCEIIFDEEKEKIVDNLTKGSDS